MHLLGGSWLPYWLTLTVHRAPSGSVWPDSQWALLSRPPTGHPLTDLWCCICSSSAAAKCLLGLLLNDRAPVILAESVDHVLAPLVACTERRTTAAKLTRLWL